MIGRLDLETGTWRVSMFQLGGGDEENRPRQRQRDNCTVDRVRYVYEPRRCLRQNERTGRRVGEDKLERHRLAVGALGATHALGCWVVPGRKETSSNCESQGRNEREYEEKGKEGSELGEGPSGVGRGCPGGEWEIETTSDPRAGSPGCDGKTEQWGDVRCASRNQTDSPIRCSNELAPDKEKAAAGARSSSSQAALGNWGRRQGMGEIRWRR
jgi:hypothetical protein